MSEAEAKEAVYGMPYDQWRETYQKKATPEQKDAFERSKPWHAVIEIPRDPDGLWISAASTIGGSAAHDCNDCREKPCLGTTWVGAAAAGRR